MTYTGSLWRSDRGRMATQLERSVWVGGAEVGNGHLNGSNFPPILADSQLELSLWIRGRYAFGWVDVWDYLTDIETGLFLRTSTDTQIGGWAAISLSDDELARIFIGPGTAYSIPSLNTASGMLIPKLRIGGASGLIVETSRTLYTPERSY